MRYIIIGRKPEDEDGKPDGDPPNPPGDGG